MNRKDEAKITNALREMNVAASRLIAMVEYAKLQIVVVKSVLEKHKKTEVKNP